MKITTKYDIGQIVYLVTDADQSERMITAININPLGITYGVTMCDEETLHYEIHISDTKKLF